MPIFSQNSYVCDECRRRYPETGWTAEEPPDGWEYGDYTQAGDDATIYCPECWERLIADDAEATDA